MRELIVSAGPNGSGKSTLRDSVEPAVDVIIDPDRIRKDLRQTKPDTSDANGARQAITPFQAAIASGKSVALETTLSGQTALRRMQDAKSAGYDIALVHSRPKAADLNVSRVPLGSGKAATALHTRRSETVSIGKRRQRPLRAS